VISYGVGSIEEFKFHLFSWNKIRSPISEGGLGIRNLRLMNQALLGKWLWRFAHKKEAWWRKILVAKYGVVWGGWRTREPSGSHGVGLWKYICRGWRLFQCHIRFDLCLGPISSFGRIFGAATRLSRLLFLVFSILPSIWIHLLRITGSA
jgi:hypothetical protein